MPPLSCSRPHKADWLPFKSVAGKEKTLNPLNLMALGPCGGQFAII